MVKGFKIPVSVLVVIHTPDLHVLLLERADHPGYWQSRDKAGFRFVAPAFTRRGLGSLASQGSSNNRSDGVEDFTLPPECTNLIFEDGFGMGSSVRWSSEVQ